MVCLPKMEGGLGIINLKTHNEGLLMKFLHKFFDKMDIPWVHLVWNNYYANGQLPGQQKKRSFSWKDIVKLLDQFKELAVVSINSGDTVLFWQDLWKGSVPQQAYPELYSFSKNLTYTFRKVVTEPLIQNFYIPLSEEAHQ